jgi:16S rRNA (cytidine1402-2'-O)-methyltransferase
MSSGALLVCATPIGNLDDVTPRVIEALRGADAAACEDTRRSRTLLQRYGVSLPLVALHEHNEAARTPDLLDRVARGQRICLLTDAGMPAVSDPGARLIAEALERDLRVVVLPGPSAVTTALVASGMAGGGFVFAGFLPRGDAPIGRLLDRLDQSGLPVVCFESPRRLPGTLHVLAARGPQRRLAICRELTKLHEEVLRGTAAELAERVQAPPKGEITLVLEAVPDAAPPTPDPALLDELAAALGPSRAAAVAARLTGLPRSSLYRPRRNQF